MPLKNHENSLSMNQRCMSRAAAGLVLKNLEQEKNGNPRKIKSSLGFHRISLVYQLQICIPTGCSEKKVMRLEHDAYASFVTLMANIFKITSWPLWRNALARGMPFITTQFLFLPILVIHSFLTRSGPFCTLFENYSKMSHLNFWHFGILHHFFLLKLTCMVTLFDC